jgi:hypothetical protein
VEVAPAWVVRRLNNFARDSSDCSRKNSCVVQALSATDRACSLVLALLLHRRTHFASSARPNYLGNQAVWIHEAR